MYHIIKQQENNIMAAVTFKTARKAIVKPMTKGASSFEITIKKCKGGLSYTLFNSSGLAIKSGADIADLQAFAKIYYAYA